MIEKTEEAENQSQWKIGQMFCDMFKWPSPDECKYIRRSAFSVRMKNLAFR
jgi:hypothetical protein